ncbi:Uncharacterized protein APZ42_010390 [Daphnia magna]|uniref:Uncharacterized protein n=1 Tax=Daphnia magna TaxID=35525 RepID=A0A164DES2_9CRUS|nr:Uncharacterized protein APZ42_010390 [Daphnia magna]
MLTKYWDSREFVASRLSMNRHLLGYLHRALYGIAPLYEPDHKEVSTRQCSGSTDHVK